METTQVEATATQQLPQVELLDLTCRDCRKQFQAATRKRMFCSPCLDRRTKERSPRALEYTLIQNIADALGGPGGSTGLSRQEVADKRGCSWQNIQNVETQAASQIYDAFVSDPEFLVAVNPNLAKHVLRPEIYEAVERPERSPLRVSFGGHFMSPKRRLDIFTLEQSVSILREEGLHEEADELEAEVRDLERRLSEIPPVEIEFAAGGAR